MIAVIGTARNAPGMPHSAGPDRQADQDRERAQVERIAEQIRIEEVADAELDDGEHGEQRDDRAEVAELDDRHHARAGRR